MKTKKYKDFDVELNDKHLLNIAKLEQLLVSNGYSVNKENIVNTYYVDFVHTIDNKYKSVITLIDKDVDYSFIRKKTFALSMANNFVGYIINGNNLDISNCEDFDVVKFINKYFGYVTIYTNDNLYNVYQYKKIMKLDKVKMKYEITKCENNTYYKITKLINR